MAKYTQTHKHKGHTINPVYWAGIGVGNWYVVTPKEGDWMHDPMQGPSYKTIREAKEAIDDDIHHTFA